MENIVFTFSYKFSSFTGSAEGTSGYPFDQTVSELDNYIQHFLEKGLNYSSKSIGFGFSQPVSEEIITKLYSSFKDYTLTISEVLINDENQIKIRRHSKNRVWEEVIRKGRSY